MCLHLFFFFFSSRRRHTRLQGDWSSDVCSSDLRITQLVLLTAAAGFYLGSRGGVDVGLLVRTLIGVALVAAGTNAFNQVRERGGDARMRRTGRRALPPGGAPPRRRAVCGAGLPGAGGGAVH